MSSNFVTFFEKLGEMLNQLSLKIPAYNEVKKCAEKNQKIISERFQESLRAFYGDLFEVFRGVARIFTQKSGSRLFITARKPVLIRFRIEEDSGCHWPITLAAF
jgi:hypothetical protein